MLIDFERMDVMPEKKPNVLVKLTEMGNVIEIQYMSNRNCKQTIKMMPGGDKFAICATGEIKDVVHHDTRAGNKKGLYKTFANVRGVINANVTNVDNVRWCTLTYAENMTDTKRLYDDFKKFNMRFQYYCERKGYGNPEYIVMMEPQGRGAWHAHLLYIWEHRAPFIPNHEFAEMWRNGFVRISQLDNVDNVGAYLTAYLGDMDLQECSSGDILGQQIKWVDTYGDDGKPIKKAVVKGARLNYYPAKFNMMRCSRGIKRPIVDMVTQETARKKVMAATKTFESAIKLSDKENGFESVIVKEQYNKIRRANQ